MLPQCDSYLSHHNVPPPPSFTASLPINAAEYDENTSFSKPEKGREAQQYFIYLTRRRYSSVIQYLLKTFVQVVFDRFWKEGM